MKVQAYEIVLIKQRVRLLSIARSEKNLKKKVSTGKQHLWV